MLTHGVASAHPFRVHTQNLCNALAAVARRLCTVSVHPNSLTAFVACRLIPLNKNPGVRPIGIGEVPRRIIAKAVLKTVSDDVQVAAGPLQTCAGHQAGCEAAVHAMKEIFTCEDTVAILLVDAYNAFNTINRQAAVHNISVVCPAISSILRNTYQAPIKLFITGEGEIDSTEGTTQGDPLAMAMYALAIRPLIDKLREAEPNARQVWFADDATAAGRLATLRQWWQIVTTIGPDFGYNPNASKTHLVVKSKLIEEAKQIFENTDVQISTNGQRHLGAAIGTREFIKAYATQKIANWVKETENLTTLARTNPHAAYAALTHGVIGKWLNFMRTIDISSSVFQPLEDAIHHQLIPALTGKVSSSSEVRKLLSLPARLGGLNIANPVEIAESQQRASKAITLPLKNMIVEQSHQFIKPQLQSIKSALHRDKRQTDAAKAEQVKEEIPATLRSAMELGTEKGVSTWLTALPLQEQGFNLNKQEFHDALCLRYGWQLKNLPNYCVCGSVYSTDHAMTCSHRGLTITRHNDVCDITANWLSEICRNVEREPPLMPLTGENIVPPSANRTDDARADIRATGFWRRQQCAFFDVRVFHPNAQSYRQSSISSLYRRHEQAKKRDRIREIENGFFTPLVFATTGGMGQEATMFYRRLADQVSDKRNTTYSKTMAWIRCTLSFSLLRSAVMCIRGSRSTSHCVPNASLELGVAESRLTG